MDSGSELGAMLPSYLGLTSFWTFEKTNGVKRCDYITRVKRDQVAAPSFNSSRVRNGAFLYSGKHGNQ